MLRLRNYWVYSAGLAIAWAIVLIVFISVRGAAEAPTILLVFGGFVIGWASTTIARYVYPPARRWTTAQR
ncbi:MAG: hypothetical protein KF692_11360 [Cryobacterium sp.]|nr:hypothetical protein [Cryobacterium sp.]MBX3091059.1 hypothetical protein [Cryobacterium sp.]